jgi:hypothetical protein
MFLFCMAIDGKYSMDMNGTGKGKEEPTKGWIKN